MILADRSIAASNSTRFLTSVALVAVVATAAIGASSNQAFALSQLKPGETQPVVPQSTTPQETAPPAAAPPATAPQAPAAPIEVPPADPIAPPAQTDEQPTPGTDQEQPEQRQPAVDQPADNSAPIDENKANMARPDVEAAGPIPEIQYDLTKLPEPVQRMRQLLVDAAISGEIANLKPLIGTGPNAPLLSLTESTDADPIAYLKSQAGDEDGREILAILEEVLNAGYVHLDVGTPQELYVWPYFFGVPLDNLTPRQKVELFKVITGGEYEEMTTFGAYIFFRVGITPAGQWAFFVTGE